MPSKLSGRLYSLIIDPLLRRVRLDVAGLVPDGSRVLEVASGSGAQARILAARGCDVLGIDLDASMVGYAAGRRPAGNMANPGALEFRVADARDTGLTAGSRDIAAITLALHAMPDGIRLPVLREMKRVAPTLIVADYASPLPHSFGGFFAGSIERIAGGAHLAGFRSYQAAGGLVALMAGAGLTVRHRQASLNGVVDIVTAE